MNTLSIKKKYIPRLLSFLPALAMMCLIFSFSSQTGEESGSLSNTVSHMLVTAGDRLLHLELSEAEIDDYTNRFEHGSLTHSFYIFS